MTTELSRIVLADGWQEIRCPNVGSPARAFMRGSLRVFVSIDPPDDLWHLSISCEHRYPKWDEIKKARYDLLPDELTMAMLLPPRAEYVNIHPNCFHLHEIREPGIVLP